MCAVEQTESVRLLMLSLSIEPGQLCNTILPSLQMLVESLMMNTSYLSDAIFQTAIGEPKAYNLHSNWYNIVFILKRVSPQWLQRTLLLQTSQSDVFKVGGQFPQEGFKRLQGKLSELMLKNYIS